MELTTKLDHVINMELLEVFKEMLKQEERSSATIEKYMRDLRAFMEFIVRGGEVGMIQKVNSVYRAGNVSDKADADTDGQKGVYPIKKETAIAYKQHLIEKYAPASVNSMLAAVNKFFREMGWYDCIVKSVKIQKEAFRCGKKELTREEYYRLLNAAKRNENKRLYMLMQTICSTGIRVSELPYITVEALHWESCGVHS